MSTATQYPHLTIDENGVLRIGETGFKVKVLAAVHYFQGWSAEEILRQYPDLKPAEVHSALTYFYDHYDATVAALREEEAEIERLESQYAPTREELLRRRDAKRLQT